ncbi:hypothetical protein L345_07990, partial [Ophiophagus hannah]
MSPPGGPVEPSTEPDRAGGTSQEKWQLPLSSKQLIGRELVSPLLCRSFCNAGISVSPLALVKVSHQGHQASASMSQACGHQAERLTDRIASTGNGAEIPWQKSRSSFGATRYLLKKVRAAGEKGKIPRVQNLRELHNFLECCKKETENAKQKDSILHKDMLP